jgi:hypothetical protein
MSSVPAQGSLSSNAGDLFFRIWPYLLALLVIAVVGGLFAMWLRRRIANSDAGASQGFTLEDLRQMHRRGEMSDEEFTKAKSIMLANRPSREEMADKLVRPKELRNRSARGARDSPTKRSPPRGDGPG